MDGTSELIDDPFLGWGDGNMADYEVCRYSGKHIEAAGKLLASLVTDPDERAVEAFRIAHNWRNAHVRPMRVMRRQLTHLAKKVSADALTAARLKRMHSIRRKLSRKNLTLYQMQDLGGCRVILPDMDALERLYAVYRDGSSVRHAFSREDDYLASPKADGYRSRHLVLKFHGADGGLHDRHKIEIQFRTQLQHVWATAMEAVGLVRNENLKGGEGDPGWRRLFVLMSAQFASEEGGVAVPDAPEEETTRRAELADLAQQLDAVKRLQSYNEMLNQTEPYRGTDAQFFLLQLDVKRMKLSVKPYPKHAIGTAAYEEEERIHGAAETVLVETDRIGDLQNAFPNYFLDVGHFVAKLNHYLGGAPPRDLSWLRDYSERRRRTSN